MNYYSRPGLATLTHADSQTLPCTNYKKSDQPQPPLKEGSHPFGVLRFE